MVNVWLIYGCYNGYYMVIIWLLNGYYMVIILLMMVKEWVSIHGGTPLASASSTPASSPLRAATHCASCRQVCMATGSQPPLAASATKGCVRRFPQLLLQSPLPLERQWRKRHSRVTPTRWEAHAAYGGQPVSPPRVAQGLETGITSSKAGRRRGGRHWCGPWPRKR